MAEKLFPELLWYYTEVKFYFLIDSDLNWLIYGNFESD